MDVPGFAAIERRGPAPFPEPTVITPAITGNGFPEVGSIVLRGGSVRGADLSRRRFDRFVAAGTVFEDCNFSETGFRSEHLGVYRGPQTIYRRCRFDGCRLGAAPALGPARFERCSFVGVRITDWSAEWAEFVECTFSGLIKDVNFYGSAWNPAEGPNILVPPRRQNEFEHNDFTRADLVGTTFRLGIDLTRQALPSDERYRYVDRYHERAESLRPTVTASSDPRFRRDALALLDFYDTVVGDRRQRQLFIERGILKYIAASAEEKLWEMLTGE